jgi:hypothetical protein
VGFGKTVEGTNGSHPTKGIRNITVTGNGINVYLVGSNIGAVKRNSGNGYELPTRPLLTAPDALFPSTARTATSTWTALRTRTWRGRWAAGYR